MRRKVIAEARSLDWGVAEGAIRRIPEVLDSEAALGILLPLSRGLGSRLVNPLTELPAILSYEFSAGVHLSSAVAALGKVKDPRASGRLVEIISELPNFALLALRALASPNHAAFAAQLATLATRWPRELRSGARGALWGMESQEALEAFIKIGLDDGDPFSEETMRRAWATRLEEKRNPRPPERQPTKPKPLPD